MKKIICFGDSITDMNHNSKPEKKDSAISLGSGYPLFLRAFLDERNMGYDVVNKGISGNRSIDLYARVKTDVWNEEPDILIILCGINDIWHEITNNNGVSLDRFKNIYDMLIRDTMNALPKTKIILLEPFVLEGKDTKDHFKIFEEIYDYSKVLNDIANKYNISFVPLQDALTKAAKEHESENVLVDGVHPGALGSLIIAREVLEEIIKYEERH